MLGLVDILQTYTVKRRLETLTKGAGYTIEGQDPRSISVVEPDAFAQRFLEFGEGVGGVEGWERRRSGRGPREKRL